MFSRNDILARVRQQPFEPFRIVTRSGQTYEVRHPDLIMVGQRDLHVGTANANDPTTYDQVTRLAIMHITALEDLPSPTSQGGNGEG
jgi:hypothetical protein